MQGGHPADVPRKEGLTMEEFLQEEGWMHLTCIVGVLLYCAVASLVERWRNRRK
ncbi:MAG: hypothetical protein PHO92_05780 [Candidatus Peribacteraceae bacterium]|nr:hypothetical protein [Candidatus Peribacteraceae bacterium]